MDASPFLPLPVGLEIEGTCVSSSALTVSVVSPAPGFACPLCHTPSRRIYSVYQRTVAYLPCGGQRLMVISAKSEQVFGPSMSTWHEA